MTTMITAPTPIAIPRKEKNCMWVKWDIWNMNKMHERRHPLGLWNRMRFGLHWTDICSMFCQFFPQFCCLFFYSQWSNVQHAIGHYYSFAFESSFNVYFFIPGYNMCAHIYYVLYGVYIVFLTCCFSLSLSHIHNSICCDSDRRLFNQSLHTLHWMFW